MPGQIRDEDRTRAGNDHALERLPLGAALREAARRLEAAGVESPRADAELLAAHLFGSEGQEVSRGQVASWAVIGDVSAPRGLDELVEARASRVPLQHLTGRAHFRNLTLAVGPGVFVPRPETEILIDELNAFLTNAPGDPTPVVVDLATGSGALALSAAQENPGCRVIGVEISSTAAEWARRNVEATGLPVDIVVGDAARALEGWESRVTAVITNPPYIPNAAVPKDPEVAEHDPALALYGGSEDGFAIPRGIVRRASELLVPGGMLIMEHAEVQAEGARELFAQAGFGNLETITDWTGRPRATKGYSGV